MSIRLSDIPVYPLYDELVLHRGHTGAQVQWLSENGTLYRSISHPRNPVSDLDRFFMMPVSTLQEIFLYGEKYYFAEYDPQYRGDDPDPRHVVSRSYRTLDALLKCEHVRNLAGCADDIVQSSWHWTRYPASLISANGELIVFQDNSIEGSEHKS